MLDPVAMDLPKTGTGMQWDMGLPSGHWGIPNESAENIDDLRCKKLRWERNDGAEIIVWVSLELGYPVRETVKLPNVERITRLRRLERSAPPQELFEMQPPLP